MAGVDTCVLARNVQMSWCAAVASARSAGLPSWRWSAHTQYCKVVEDTVSRKGNKLTASEVLLQVKKRDPGKKKLLSFCSFILRFFFFVYL
jgi:hypothetical protein